MKRLLLRKATKLLNRNFDLAKAWKYRQYERAHRGKLRPLVVYQMGKVGSSSLLHSLERMPSGFDIFHVHVLTHEWIDILQQQYRHTSAAHGRAIIHEHLLASLFLRKQLDKGIKHVGWKVISLVRDPISRNLSAFFETLPTYFPDIVHFDEHDSRHEDRIPELIDVFLNRFEEHQTPLRWFDTHMKPVFGIDVMASSFPHQQGYEIYKKDDAELLVIRAEDLTRCASKAISEFLGIDDFSLENANVTSAKSYSNAYNQFKKTLKLPDTYIDMMYNSSYATHFYSKDEIAELRAKWTAE